MTTLEQQQAVRVKLLGNPDFVRKLKRELENYDTDADADRYAERICELVAKESGLVCEQSR